MPPNARELLRQIQREEATLDEIERKYSRAIKRLYKTFRRRLREVLENPALYTRADRIELRRSLRLAERLGEFLSESGLNNLAENYVREFPRLANEVLDYFRLFETAKIAGYTAEQRRAFRSVVRQYRRNLARQVSQSILAPAESAISSAAAAGLERAQAIETIMSTVDGLSPARLETLTVDQTAQFQRAARAAQAENLGMELYTYIGPLDGITSEQCRFLLTYAPNGVPGLLYKDQISADLQENLQADPLIYGGHPNCRHHYRPVTLEFAETLPGFQQRG